MDRDEAIDRIRRALKARSGKAWSVKGGTGTSWGWIRIGAQPKRCAFEFDGTPTEPGKGYMGPSDREELGKLLGLGHPAHHQGESVPASTDYREEYVARAEGRTPAKIVQPYWD